MSIITENQKVKAGVHYESGGLHIRFEEDPSFIRSETVLVDLMENSIGLVFQSSYHHIGDLPKNMIGKDVEALVQARLLGHGAGGREITLHAPIKFVRSSVRCN